MKGLVITPTLGLSPWLDDTLLAVERGSVRHELRHVLVCPPDRRADLVKRAKGHVTVVPSTAQGVYGALNAGLVHAGGMAWDALTWLNDDDGWAAGAVDPVLDQLEVESDSDIVYGRTHYIDAAGEHWGYLPVCPRPRDLPLLFSKGVPAISQHGTWMRRGTVEELGAFDARFRLAADFDWWARALASGKRFSYASSGRCYYRLHGGQLSQSVDATAAEIKASARSNFPKPNGRGINGALLRFRWVSLLNGWDRWRRTGCWRSAALYRRAASRSDPLSKRKERPT